jgi:hypothetical protein
MKNSVININSDNGHIDFLNLNLSPEFKESDLPDSFTRKHIEANERQYVFANIEQTENNTLYNIGLKFEAGKLLGISLEITPPEHNYTTSDDFYNGTTERWNYHCNWLGKQLAPHKLKWGWTYEFSWGIAYVYRDKSENIAISVNYEENNFAISKGVAASNKLRGCPE